MKVCWSVWEYRLLLQIIVLYDPSRSCTFTFLIAFKSFNSHWVSVYYLLLLVWFVRYIIYDCIASCIPRTVNLLYIEARTMRLKLTFARLSGNIHSTSVTTHWNYVTSHVLPVISHQSIQVGKFELITLLQSHQVGSSTTHHSQYTNYILPVTPQGSSHTWSHQAGNITPVTWHYSHHTCHITLIQSV